MSRTVLDRIELWLLFEETDGETRRDGRLALKILIDAGQNPQQRTFPGAVQADDADLRAVEIRQVDVLEDSFLVVDTCLLQSWSR